MKPGPPKIFILSGEFDAGKTTLLIQLLERLRAQKLLIKGVVSLPVVENGVKIAIDLLDVSTQQVTRLAEMRKGEGIGVFTSRWQFLESAMDLASRILEGATPCEVLVVDELGPLEFERGSGWQSGLAAVDSRDYRTCLVVIRSSLLPKAKSRWPEAIVHEITRETQSVILNILLGQILESGKE